jgi:hypothetical protein
VSLLEEVRAEVPDAPGDSALLLEAWVEHVVATRVVEQRLGLILALSRTGPHFLDPTQILCARPLLGRVRALAASADYTTSEIATEILANVGGGQVSRQRAEQLFAFAADGAERNIACRISYDAQYATTGTAALLWPAAVRFCCVVVDALSRNAATAGSLAPPLARLRAHLAGAGPDATVLEIGCGVALASTVIAAAVAGFASPGNDRKVQHIVADCHRNATANACANVERASGAPCEDVVFDWADAVAVARVAADTRLQPSVVIGTEVIYDEEMGRHVARLLRALMPPGAAVPAYIAVMDYRVGRDRFRGECEALGLRCTAYAERDLDVAAEIVYADESAAAAAASEGVTRAASTEAWTLFEVLPALA